VMILALSTLAIAVLGMLGVAAVVAPSARHDDEGWSGLGELLGPRTAEEES
jgi:hypothetical protein